MMLYPSVNDLMKKINSRYSLVVAVAKRAREIYQTGVTFTDCNCDKPVSVAVKEINENKVSFKSPTKTMTEEKLMNLILSENMDI